MTSTLKVSTIQDPTNSNSAISIDTSGHVSHPVRPYFSVRQNSGQSVASGTQTTMLHPTSISERGSDYNSSTGKSISYSSNDSKRHNECKNNAFFRKQSERFWTLSRLFYRIKKWQ